MTTKQKTLMEQENWDYLIILDACRYDYFERSVHNFFTGTLIEAVSGGSCTLEWCKRTFDADLYDQVAYVSSNPFINSKMELRGFRASNVFQNVIDVWQEGWDEELGTVPPGKVSEAALDAMNTGDASKMIIHYLQPHTPYLSEGFRGRKFSELFNEVANFLEIRTNTKIERSYVGVARLLDPWLRSKLKTLFLYYLQLFNKPPFSPIDETRRTHGVKGLRQAYAETLDIALREIQGLCRKTQQLHPGARMVLTSDHYESLGEAMEYGHMCGRDSKILLTVPWFTVETALP